MSRKNDKRERLVEAADELIYQQTFSSTTLADIAQRADVPLGNVYYYFKTKDEILKAVVQKRLAELHALFATWEEFPDAKARLRAFIGHNVENSEAKARFGCVLGSLCQELGKQTTDLAAIASDLMLKILGWAEAQFKAMGKGDRSKTLAEYLVAGLQGVSLLTLTFKDPSFLKKQSEHLERWLETA